LSGLRRLDQAHPAGWAEHVLLPALPVRMTCGGVQIWVVVSALRADSFEPPACVMLRRGKQARRYSNLGHRLTWNRFDAQFMGL